MEGIFKLGEIFVSKTGGDEYTIVDMTSHLIAVHPRSSGMKLEWWTKEDVKNQIANGVFEIK